MVNTDARSILCTTGQGVRLAGRLPFQGDDNFSRELNASFRARSEGDSLKRTAAVLNELRTRAPTVENCALDRILDWRFDTSKPITMTNGHLAIRHIRVRAETREVTDFGSANFR